MTAPIRPLASLTGALLARKGEARPAMRPTRSTDTGAAGDALGWNDLGGAVPPEDLPDAPIQPGVLDDIARDARGKAAFTLRLDPARHLRLRLAAATRRRSAQQIVTEALDAFLSTLPEVETLARSLPPGASDHPEKPS